MTSNNPKPFTEHRRFYYKTRVRMEALLQLIQDFECLSAGEYADMLKSRYAVVYTDLCRLWELGLIIRWHNPELDALDGYRGSPRWFWSTVQ